MASLEVEVNGAEAAKVAVNEASVVEQEMVGEGGNQEEVPSESSVDKTVEITEIDGNVESDKVDDSNMKEDDLMDDSKSEAASDRTGEDTTTTNERTWDHTNRKVIVQNVLKFVRPKEVPKLIKTWLSTLDDPNSIRVDKVKKPPKDSWMLLTLEHEDMVQPFLDHMNSNRFTNRKGKPIYARRADSKFEKEIDNNGNKRKGDDSPIEQEQDAKRRKSSGPKTKDEVRDTITPLWRLDYEAQLDTKQREMIKRCAMKIVQEIKAKFRTLEKEARKNKHRDPVPMYDWVKGKRAIEVQKILPSPTKTEYRNKCEMNFGYRHEVDKTKKNDCESKDDTTEVEDPVTKNIPSVGFMASGWSGGVSRPHFLANIPSEACAIADIVEEFLASSPIPPYDSRDHRGLWRTLTVRTSTRTGECMVIIVHAPPSGGVGAKDDTDDYSNVFESEKQRLLSMLTANDLPDPERDFASDAAAADTTKASLEADSSPTPIRVTSVFFQEFDGLSNPGPEHPVQHAFGKLAMQERLGPCTFQVSPGAFFQVNTEGAEILYNAVVEKVREASPKPEETLLFDVCCGTGTIGLTCMKEGVVGRVVGVDISEPAIEDAKINAVLNGFGTSDDASERTRFVAARAEHVLSKEIKKEDGCSSVIAVVDPAREGLHTDVVRTLRMTEKIKRLVYVSCNPTSSLIRDAALLCGPPTNKYPGRAFRPTSAQPVDMFPLTPHCEMVMTFDRLEK